MRKTLFTSVLLGAVALSSHAAEVKKLSYSDLLVRLYDMKYLST